MDRRLAALAVAAAGVGALAFWLVQRTVEREAAPGAPPSVVRTPRRPATVREREAEPPVVSSDSQQAAAAPDDEAAQQPPVDTPPEPTGPLAVDAAGNFYPRAETIQLIESRLQAPGQTRDRGLAAVRAEIAAALDPPAEQQALDFVDNYMRYRDRGVALGLAGDFAEDVRPRFAQLRSLRREFFGIEVGQRLFGEEEAADALAIREEEILGETGTPEDERARRLGELYNPVPPRRE